MLLHFKIQLKGVTKPPVWRGVVVPAEFTFQQLHLVIQVAFGWENAHLFSFSPQGYGSYPVISVPDDWEEPDMVAENIKLKSIFKEVGQTFTYIYDFGDDWIHKMTLENIISEVSSKASCLAGKGKCPPEDCGGPVGYGYLKDVLKNPNHEEYEDMREWLCLEDDEEWNANEFDLAEADREVKRV